MFSKSVLLWLISHTSVITPLVNWNLQWCFSRSPSPSNSDLPIRRWGILCSRIYNASGILRRQRQTQAFPSGGGASRGHGLTTCWAYFVVGRLAFTSRQHARRSSSFLNLYQNIVVLSVYIFYVLFKKI